MDKIGPYEILEVLHRGPQPLYRVKAADGRVLALKAAPVANSTPETRERFLREGETCRAFARRRKSTKGTPRPTSIGPAPRRISRHDTGHYNRESGFSPHREGKP